MVRQRTRYFARIRANLIPTDNKGMPFVRLLPLHLLVKTGETLLLGHYAKPNLH